MNIFVAFSYTYQFNCQAITSTLRKP